MVSQSLVLLPAVECVLFIVIEPTNFHLLTGKAFVPITETLGENANKTMRHVFVFFLNVIRSLMRS